MRAARVWVCLWLWLGAWGRPAGAGADAGAGAGAGGGPRVLHVAVALAEPDAGALGRAFNRSLANASRALLAEADVSLQPLIVTWPERGAFSGDALRAFCAAVEGRRVAAVLLLGGEPGAAAVAMAAAAAGVPLLWARASHHAAFFHQQPWGPLEVRLEARPAELWQAVRALLLAAHWHAFSVLAEPSALHATDLAAVLRRPPLSPTIILLRADAHPKHLFRRLADVSRATRGVVLLVCDAAAARRVSAVARRLNMLSGHFVWLWLDTGGRAAPLPPPPPPPAPPPEAAPRPRPRPAAALVPGDFARSPPPPPPPVARAGHSSPARQAIRAERVSDVVSMQEGGAWRREAPRPDAADDAEERGELAVGLLSLRAAALPPDKAVVRAATRLLVGALRAVLRRCADDRPQLPAAATCWADAPAAPHNFSTQLARELREVTSEALAGSRPEERAVQAVFYILNLVPSAVGEPLVPHAPTGPGTAWRLVGQVTGRAVRLDSIVWPGGELVGAPAAGRSRSVFRIVTALAPPFVMEGELDEDGQCLRGLPCHRVPATGKDNLTLVFNDMDDDDDSAGDEKRDAPDTSEEVRYRTSCCYGLAMDLLENVAQELEFDFHLYLVADGMFGTRYASPAGASAWNGVMGELVSGAAHMSFAALSVSSARSEVIDFSAPYFFSGVSFLAAPAERNDVPLLAFLLPFSPELWIAIFTSLNITAMAVAVYEWLSPFGLNPWGRQRSKNFSIASALWVMWGLLCGHLVAFKAPKSWPNKFLINVWGGFSVIFVASYTANIAALIAGLFFQNAVSNYHDRSLLSQRVGAPRASAAEYYVHKANQLLWQHMQRFSVRDVQEGIAQLKNGSLDILIADTPILDYYRATDHGCKLQKIGDAINEDTYAVGMTKGFPLKDSISAVISKYSNNGYMDILQEKWYGALPCFKLATDMAQPRPLGVAAVAGVFILLGVGMALGLVILLVEHLFYRYTLPILRHKPKGTIWRSRNIMFFSQKLYRFINCVELVSPHHAARELVHTLRQGQITSLFQKSVKREHEQRRRRKSKAQFFEMIQEIRRVQQEKRDDDTEAAASAAAGAAGGGGGATPRASPGAGGGGGGAARPSPRARARRPLLSPAALLRPRPRSPAARRYSTDMVLASAAVGRRLSKDWEHSPPDINSRRASNLDVRPTRPATLEHLRTSPVRETASASNLSGPARPRPYSASATWARENPHVGARLGSSASLQRPRRRARSDAEPADRPRAARRKPEYESIIEVNVTCCDPPADDGAGGSGGGAGGGGGGLGPAPARGLSVSRTALLSPLSLREAASPSRRRHRSNPAAPADSSFELSTSSVSLSPLQQELDEEVFENIPPPPPPPNCNTHNSSSGASSPLERLEREELVMLWCSSESELRSQLLRAIQAKEPP